MLWIITYLVSVSIPQHHNDRGKYAMVSGYSYSLFDSLECPTIHNMQLSIPMPQLSNWIQALNAGHPTGQITAISVGSPVGYAEHY